MSGRKIGREPDWSWDLCGDSTQKPVEDHTSNDSKQTLGAKLRRITKAVRIIQPEVIKAQIKRKCEEAAGKGDESVTIRFEDLGAHWSQFPELQKIITEFLKTQECSCTFTSGYPQAFCCVPVQVNISWPLPKDDS